MKLVFATRLGAHFYLFTNTQCAYKRPDLVRYFSLLACIIVQILFSFNSMFYSLPRQVHVSFSQHGDKDSVHCAVLQRGAAGGGAHVPSETPVPADLAAENHHSWKRLQKHDESSAFSDRNHQVQPSRNVNQHEAPHVLLHFAFTINFWTLNVFLKRRLSRTLCCM